MVEEPSRGTLRAETTRKNIQRGVVSYDGLGGTRFHWLVGAKDPEAITPDNWVLDQALLDRPGTQDRNVDLLENYKTNICALSALASGRSSSAERRKAGDTLAGLLSSTHSSNRS